MFMGPWIRIGIFHIYGFIVPLAFPQFNVAQTSFSMDTYVLENKANPVIIKIESPGVEYDAMDIDLTGVEMIPENIFVAEPAGETLFWLTRDSVLFNKRQLFNSALIVQRTNGYRIRFSSPLTSDSRLFIQTQCWGNKSASEMMKPDIRINLFKYSLPTKKNILLSERPLTLKR